MSDKYRKSFTFEGKRYFVRGKSETDAIIKMANKIRDLEEGRVMLCGSMHLKDWYNEYVKTYRVGCKDITQKNYDCKMKKHVLSIIGDLPLKAVKPLHCQKVLNSLEGYSADSINKVYQGMCALFRSAVDNKLIIDNPCTGLVKPSGTRSKRRAITDFERKYILEVADTNPRFLFYLFMLFCGCRPSEAAAIRGMDIDRDKKLVKIIATKTGNKERLVPIPDYLYDRIPSNLNPFTTICTNTVGKKLDESGRQHLWNAFKRELNLAAGCKMHRNQLVPPYPIAEDLVPYCLRHTFCTDLQKAGVDIRVAQYLMGHASITMTANIYTHIDEETIADTATKMNTPVPSTVPKSM